MLNVIIIEVMNLWINRRAGVIFDILVSPDFKKYRYQVF